MMTPIATVILALCCIGLGIGIAEYYHIRIDRARDKRAMKQPEMWNLTHPAPQPIVYTQDYAHLRKTGRITKLTGEGRE